MGSTDSNRRFGAKKGEKGRAGDDWKGFLEVTLSAEDLERVKALADGREYDGQEIVERFLGDGYKVSLSPDVVHNCVVAAATSREKGGPNYGYTLVARGPDGYCALVGLYFKAYVLSEDGSWEESAHLRQVSMWG